MSLEVFVVLPCNHSVKETIDRLVILLQQADMTIYARINRQIEARWYSRVTRPLEFILFDDPRISAPMFERNPIMALCFPARIIAWEDEIGRCRIAFKDPLEIIKEFGEDRNDCRWPDLRPEITRALLE
ncbi:MAG TPA: DUF302 domain-containing protein [Puia sp.]|nr:DUF302 domain-containing protein [Puia sp.]